ncbi:MAG: uncharacterized protein JWQ09_429 [Segetibacter sp.]|nr:uncharacterized protein [Segetibacter sp.]
MLSFFSKAWNTATENSKAVVAAIAKVSVEAIDKTQAKYEKTKEALAKEAVLVEKKVKESIEYSKKRIKEGAEFIKEEAIQAKDYTTSKIKNLYNKAKQIALNIRNFITTTCPLIYKENLAKIIDSSFSLFDNDKIKIKPKEDEPTYPTVSKPGIGSKEERYKARLNKIAIAKSYKNAELQKAAKRLELNNRAVERAKLSNHSYNLDPDHIPEGWKPVPHDTLPEGLRDQVWKDDTSGFQAEIYLNTFEPEGKEKYVIAFRGTDNKGGVKDDIKQALGLPSKQYQETIDLAKALRNSFGPDRIEFTGHSLGGGLSSTAGMLTGSKTYTFNGAGVHPDTLKDSGIIQKDLEDNKNIVEAFSSSRDPLNQAQDNRGYVKTGLIAGSSSIPLIGPGLSLALSTILLADPNCIPKAVGNRHIITPPVPNQLDNRDIVGRLKEGHGMDSLIVGIEQEKEEDIAIIDRLTRTLK